MVIRQRAIQAEDKQERHDAILDAAERLLVRSPDRVASVAEVADEAGLAKGTVYLYFPSKEALLLAIHERGIDGFFRAVIALAEGDAPMGIDDMLELTHRHLVDAPLYLPLASRCFGLMAHAVPPDAAAFKQRMAARLERAGAGLERQFRELGPGDGVALLRRSYALILGLWQMSASASEGLSQCAMVGVDGASPVFAWRYADELDRALRALWQGTVGNVPAR
ncbi:MAG: TetR family transcriptional regulator [Betaproteobacteria bacterium]